MKACPYAVQVRQFIRESLTVGEAAFLELPLSKYDPASKISRQRWLIKLNNIASREGAKMRCRCKSGGIELTILE